MRRSFFVLTALAAIAAVALGAWRLEPAYHARMGVADLREGRFPRRYLASSLDEPNLTPAVIDLLKRAADATEPAEKLAYVELQAAGVLSPSPDENIISGAFEELLEEYPDSPLIRYRYGAWLLTRLQQLAAARPGGKWLRIEDGSASELAAHDLARRAKHELFAAAANDPYNSLPIYELAYCHYIFGENDKAIEYLHQAVEAPEFDPGDDVMLRAGAGLVLRSGAPPLEGLITTYRVASYAPSRLAGRMEALVAGLLNDSVYREHVASRTDYMEYMVGFEDLSVKLFHTAEVLRQSQASLVASGILWRKVARQAASDGDARLAAAARAELAKASYRYLLVGFERAGAGLMPQQGILDLDTPLEMRLPFSNFAQTIAGVTFMLLVILVLPAVILGLLSIRVKQARQLSLALCTLSIFVALAYVGSFYATLGERGRVSGAVERRLRVLRQAPEALRAEGELDDPSDFRLDVAKNMLPVTNYTMQAGRVLAYVGTRDCYDALIDALSQGDSVRPVEIITVLKEETGQDFGFRRDGTAAENAKAIEAWKTWWQAKRSTYPEHPAQSRGA